MLAHVIMMNDTPQAVVLVDATEAAKKMEALKMRYWDLNKLSGRWNGVAGNRGRPDFELYEAQCSWHVQPVEVI